MAQDELVYSVSLDWDKMGFTSLNTAIDKSIKLFAIATAAIAAASSAVFAMGKNYAETSDELLKTAQRVNATTQEIQKLTFAAEDNGATMSDVTGSLESLAKAKEQMLRGSGDFEAWGRLGVNPTEYANTSDLLLDIADRVKDLDSQQAIDLMSRVGISPQLLQTLQQGRQGLKELADEAERLGIIKTPEMIKNSQDFMKGWLRASMLINGILDKIESKLLGDTINPAIEAFNNFMSENMEEISKILTKIVDFLVKASQAIFAVFHTIYIQFERLSGLLGGTEQAIKALAAVFVILKGRVIASMLPAILAAGALYLAFDDLMSFLEDKESYIGDFFGLFGIGSKDARESIGWLLDGIMSIPETIKVAWDIISNYFQILEYKIQDLMATFGNLGSEITNALDFTGGIGSFFSNPFDMFSSQNNQPQAQTTNNSQVVVNVNGATDPNTVSDLVVRKVREEMNNSAMRAGH